MERYKIKDVLNILEELKQNPNMLIGIQKEERIF